MRIHRLDIRRYRGIKEMRWCPRAELNCLVGPGDAGKSTVLQAIRLLGVRRTPRVSEFDYFRREVEEGFEITAVLGDLGRITDHLRQPPVHGWQGGQVVPIVDAEGAEPVMLVRVEGTPDLEVDFGLVGPDGEEIAPLPSKVRRRFGMTWIEGGRRAMAELRFSRGSLLKRHAGDMPLHGAVTAALSEAAGDLSLPEEAADVVSKLGGRFTDAGLPGEVQLGLIPPPHRSLMGMVGLMEGQEDEPEAAIPLAFAGTGTTRMVLFEMTALLAEDAETTPLVIVDEPEVGLEPYRQRQLVSRLRELAGDRGQVFMTTHSPAVLGSLEPGEVFRLAADADPVPLKGDLRTVLQDDPEAFLARLPVICEGATEQGLLAVLLGEIAQQAGTGSGRGVEGLDPAGIRLVDLEKAGQPKILDWAQSILEAGVTCGVFADAEKDHSGKRQRLKDHARCAFAEWPVEVDYQGTPVVVRNIEQAVAWWLPFDTLPRLVETAAELAHKNSTQPKLMQLNNEVAGKSGTDDLTALREQFGEHEVRAGLARAMLDKQGWFKSVEGGRRLAEVLLDVGVPAQIDRLMQEFWGEISKLR